MTRQRVPETSEGIQNPITVEQYDLMLRTLRDRGWMETKAVIRSGIAAGKCLEIGPGPGYLGIEWLKLTTGTTLTTLEISEAMRDLAERNAGENGVRDRWSVTAGNAMDMPFDDATFDAVFSNGSLHEWERPMDVLNEVQRVLKPRGRFFISDLRRDMAFPIRWFLWLTTKPKAIRPGLLTSIDAAYTPKELEELVGRTELLNATVGANPIGVTLSGFRAVTA